MANFNTHLAGAAVVAGITVSGALSFQLITIGQAATLWLVGMLGGIMPDVDSDNSHAVSAMFTGLGALASFLTAQKLAGLPLLTIWLAMMAAFFIVRVPLIWVFKELTVHRGAFHSLIAAVSFGLGTTFFSYKIFAASINYAWAIGFMMFVGYITHLLLDELYSVDLSGMTIKRSFGTAIKPIDLDSIPASIVFALVAFGSWWFMPTSSYSFASIPSFSNLKGLMLGT
ncbi:metal-dependent hydrolase [Marinibactrum halimedae]|uniref:Membrane protein n=1 Tax=Marinibactrum halimedae TaxID=1444977 RepID=A0AA37WN91_9GAMM|nr:metal-dependent hydrolase [Marinibactrum halimedae]MCD9458217.1 metal-dependent hydrolase [Marinibactrum halimedae]GLS27155.1 membrane protein [Marinibactrum halimedae]